jgi:DedD protein
MSDEGLHEIQLDGKQLVFLFMTATVVAVVIFLCGVMVGRGVPAQRAGTMMAAEGADPTIPDDVRVDADAVATPAAGAGPSASSRLGLTYPARLEEPEPVAEDVPASATVREPFATTAVAKAPPPGTAKSASSKQPVATTAVATAPAADAAPTGSGFVVQVAAVRQRGEADTIRSRLAKKGYPVFVTTASTSGGPTTYRVRVGKYASRREADTVAAKLEREEQFKPWVTR